MNNHMNGMNGHFNEIRVILDRINVLQRRAVKAELNETCDLNVLRCNVPILEVNTRPITLYGCCDRQLAFPINRLSTGCDGESPLSCVFRVENIRGDSVTCRVLSPIEGAEGICAGRFLATNSFFTLRMADISAIRCLDDTFVDLCIR